MSQSSIHGKEPVIDLCESPISKRTRKASAAFDNKRFKTLLDFQTFNNLFKNASSVVERTMQFKSLSSTFIPGILADKD